MEKLYILAHGFGFDDRYWDNFIDFLDPKDYVFYHENIEIPRGRRYIGVGHSLGYLKLNNSDIPFDCLISLQGFLNFCGNDEKLRKIRLKYLDKTYKNFEDDHKDALSKFIAETGYRGVFDESATKINKNDLLNDLRLLYSGYEHNKIKTLALGSCDDEIVPMSLIYDNFEGLENVWINEVDGEMGHSLGYDEASQILDIIDEFSK